MQVTWLLAVLLIAGTCSAAEQTASVYFADSKYTARLGVLDRSAAAFGVFDDSLNSTGWGVLNVATNSSFDDRVQMYAAGVLEGFLTNTRVYENILNMRNTFFGDIHGSPSTALLDFFLQQDKWVEEQIAGNATSDLWMQIDYIQNQLHGLQDGFFQRAPNADVKYFDFQMLQAAGDLLDLMNVVDPSSRRDWKAMSLTELRLAVFKRSMCSALVKVTYNNSNLFSAHSSWFTYSAMNRIYKHYTLDLSASFVKTKTMSFSSYPGFLESLDDFYIMSSGLVMLQTTNSIFNNTLYDLVVPQSLFAWQRVRAANSMASSGSEWFDVVKQYNSGTYNNQYMVVDHNLFVPNSPLPANLLWVVEQIPGLMVGADTTTMLEDGYWPSYNVPFFKEVYDLSGYPEVVKMYGNSFSYDLCARAQMFRRDQNKVTDITTFKALMRYNDFRNDPISNGDASDAICSRGDMASPPYAGGCYDTKVTQYEWVKNGMRAEALNGPTTSASYMKPFSWANGEFTGVAHVGEPTVFNFSFITVQPTL